MRVGVVTKWFNRGQPVVGRHTRSALDSLGHETFVLARPKKEQGPQPGALSRDDVWDQPGVTEASAYDIPLADYTEWIEREGIEAILCDQNYGFAELAELRKRGVQGDRALRVGALHRRARRGRAKRLRRRLLDDARRAGALPRDGPRDAIRAVGLPPGARSRSAMPSRANAER